FAAGTGLQQRGALQTPASEEDARVLLQILREPTWIAGALAQAAGWVLQGAALDRGSVVVVAFLATLSVVIAAPLGVRLTQQHVGGRDLTAAFVVVGGIVVFLAVGAPESGTSTPSAAEWWTAGLVSLVLVLGVAAVGRTRRGAVRAALYGTAAGIG